MSKTPSAVVDRLHELTHQVPGVPEHAVHANTSHRDRSASNRRRHPKQVNRVHHHDSPPRVFIAWQDWIGRLVRRER